MGVRVSQALFPKFEHNRDTNFLFHPRGTSTPKRNGAGKNCLEQTRVWFHFQDFERDTRDVAQQQNLLRLATLLHFKPLPKASPWTALRTQIRSSSSVYFLHNLSRLGLLFVFLHRNGQSTDLSCHLCLAKLVSQNYTCSVMVHKTTDNPRRFFSKAHLKTDRLNCLNFYEHNKISKCWRLYLCLKTGTIAFPCAIVNILPSCNKLETRLTH